MERKSNIVQLAKSYAMKLYEYKELELHIFLTLALDNTVWLVTCTGCLIPRKRLRGIIGHEDWQEQLAKD
jgi:hypothetical protein